MKKTEEQSLYMMKKVQLSLPPPPLKLHRPQQRRCVCVRNKARNIECVKRKVGGKAEDGRDEVGLCVVDI